MAVYIVEHTYTPNGNKMSRPVVARSPEAAQLIRQCELDIPAMDLKDFTVTVTERPDPDGHYAELLMDGEQRRKREELWDRR